MKNIKRSHHSRAVVIAALAVAVLGLGVAFAALSTTLNINGTAKVVQASWKVKYFNSQGCDEYGEAKVTGDTVSSVSSPDDTWTIAATFKAPGDSVTCEIEMANVGTIDAKLSGLSKSLAALTGANITATLEDYPPGATGPVTPKDGDIYRQYEYHGWDLTLTYNGPLLATDSPQYAFSFTLPFVQAN